MGQAKKRGTFEQRKAEAIERKADEKQSARWRKKRPHTRLQIAALAAMLWR